jgi:hypothetical protein
MTDWHDFKKGDKIKLTNTKIHNQEYEIEELKNLLYDVTHYYDDVLPQIRDKLEAS